MDSSTLDTDVVICGGGMAGLCLARQIRQQLPQFRVVVIERTRRPLALGCHKVGESSVELGSQYLERLGLGDYLQQQHIIKFGLRFYPGGGHLRPEQRTELGPANEPIVRSYQIDRGRFESDLRGMIEEDGVTLHEGAMVRKVDLGAGDEPHAITFVRDGESTTLRSRWVVDATGRNAFFKRRMRLKRGTRHAGNAGWFRVEGRVELAQMVADDDPWHKESFAPHRWRSTTHLMGRGYWVWLIPLSCGQTSVGIVTHDACHDFDTVRTHDRCMAFLREHEPALFERLDGVEALDFRTLHGYSYNVSRSWHADRWAVVGEAGAFTDPLYSPGSDFIAFANAFTVDLMQRDAAGEDLRAPAGALNAQYRALVSGALLLVRDAAEVYGHARAMAAKIYWDNFVYWCFTCHYYLQGVFRASGPQLNALTEVGGRWVELAGFMQKLLSAWATVAPERTPPAGFMGVPAFPSLPIDAHLDLQRTMELPETIDYMRERLVQAEQMATELVVRVLMELGPTLGAQVLSQAEAERWTLQLVAERAQLEPLEGAARQEAIGTVIQDIERCLGRVDRHPQWAEALTLIASQTRSKPVARAAAGGA